MKVGICFKSSSEMSDRLFEGITTYGKCQNFQLLDFNQLNILFGKEKKFPEYSIPVALLWDYSQGRQSFGDPNLW